jgi:two-component system, NarL family, response regulator DevR
MTTVFIARRHPSQARATQAQLQASRTLHVLGVAGTLFRTREDLRRVDAELLLIDLRLEDGAALSLVRELRARGSDRPRVMLCAERADDPLLFSTLVAGADAYVLDADPTVPAIERLAAGGASMAPAVAAQALAFFNEVQRPRAAPSAAPAPDARRLDWATHAANPMRLSPGECRLLQLLAGGATTSEVAVRCAQSLESIGRRIANLYRKLSWDVRSGSLALLAA